MHRIRQGPAWTAALTPTNLCCGLAVIALAAGLIFLTQNHTTIADRSAQSHRAVSDRSTGPDIRAARAKSWDKAEGLLAQTEQHSRDALDKHLASIHAFLDERQVGSRAFAQHLLGLRGKWELVKAEISRSGDYAAFLQKAFSDCLFPIEDLEKAVTAAVQGYLAELDGLEDDLLVRLRQDLSDEELPRRTIPALRSDQAFRDSYHTLSQRVVQDLRTDLAITGGRELFYLPTVPVATDLTLAVADAVVARLGLSGTILSVGAGTSWRTLGMSLVVALVFDRVLTEIIKAAGYDAEKQIAQRLRQTLSDLGRTITDGDPHARATLVQLQALQRDDPDAEVRRACTEAIQSIEAGTRLYGLRGALTKIGADRASLRRETLRRLIQDPEVTR
jgi:hypothetical protein